MKSAAAALRPLVRWRRGVVEYRIQRGQLGALLLMARGPGGKVRATALHPATRAPVSRLDKAQRATSGWRGISAPERTRLAELLLTQQRGVLRRLA